MNVDIITIGTATRDCFIKSSVFHVDADSHILGGKGLVMPLGAKLEIPDIFFSTGGGATNAAVTFARQGLHVACVAVVGRDVSGQQVIDDLKRENVHTALIRYSTEPTGYSILLEPPSGERTVLVHRGASEKFTFSSIPWNRIRAQWFYISSLAGNIGLLKRIVSFARSNGVRICYNPGGKELDQRNRLLPLLKHIDIVSVNREEASLITGVPFERIHDLFKTWDDMSPGINVMSDGHNGSYVSDGKNFYHAGIYKERKMVDRTGAGDAFGSGFVAGIVRAMRSNSCGITELDPEYIEYAIRLGSANATAKVEGMGAKYGLLTQRQFERGKRWKDLKITRTPL